MRNTRLAVILLAGLIPACAPQISRPPQPQQQAPGNFPDSYYQQALARGEPVFRVDPDRSIVLVEVRRAGSLARFGHDHVVASRDLRGYVTLGEGRSDLYVQLDRLEVDEPALRAEAGFDARPSEADIAGTRRNMLEKVLETGRYPFALIHVSKLDAGRSGPVLNVEITLHGITRALQIPAQIETGADQIGVTGRLALDQTDFGISPFSILGGAIQVQDRVELRFRIRARRID